MCTCATAKAARRKARIDPRYQTAESGNSGKAARRAFMAAKAAKEGRSFGYSKK